jgi:DHA2 family multidrug resistance protein
MALDHAALQAPHGLPTPPARVLGAWVGQEAAVLSAADVYRLAAVLTLILIPVVLRLQRIPAPVTASTAPAP